jgi:hypothetical protein
MTEEKKKIACAYCKVNFDSYELRPYGHKGAMICFDCAMKPDNKKETEKNFEMQLDAALSAGNNVAIIGEETGPRPLNTDSLV